MLLCTGYRITQGVVSILPSSTIHDRKSFDSSREERTGAGPETESFFSITPVPSGAGAVRHMVFDERTNSIWFGTDTNNLGQAKLPPPGVPAPPPEPEVVELESPAEP